MGNSKSTIKKSDTVNNSGEIMDIDYVEELDIDFLKKKLPGFKYVKQLGKGGFGETHLMVNGNKKIAVKSVRNRGKNKFLTGEIEVLDKIRKGCSTNNVLCFHTYFENKNVDYFVTEYIKSSPITNSKSLNQLIKAIDFIHSLGVIHFDIKPENIIFSRKSGLKLIDFGCAQVKKNERVKLFCYTESYAPPTGLIDTSKTISFKKAKLFDWFCFIKTMEELFPDIQKCVLKINKVEDIDFVIKYIRQYLN